MIRRTALGGDEKKTKRDGDAVRLSCHVAGFRRIRHFFGGQRLAVGDLVRWEYANRWVPHVTLMGFLNVTSTYRTR